jgi:glycosyltransferase involved in cell wall biosynthesis
MEQAATLRPWLYFMGPKYGMEKARLLAVGDVLLLPASVGISILDGFAAGLPCITANFDDHGPEIAYLKPDNGVMTPTQPAAYAEAVRAILVDRGRLMRMAAAARAAATQYSIDAMIQNFATGAVAAVAR